MSTTRPLTFTLGVLICFSAALACSDGSAPPSGAVLDGPGDLLMTDGPAPVTTDTGPPRDAADLRLEGDASIDATPDGGADLLGDAKARTITGADCHQIGFGPLVTPTRLVTLPMFTGGTITDGTYDAMVEEIAFNSPERTANTIKFEGTSFFWVSFLESSTNRNDFEERSRGSFSVSGSTLSLAGTCGSTVVRQYSFSASGDELLLHQSGRLLRMRRR